VIARGLLLALLAAGPAARVAPPTRVGFVVHFDCLADEAEARAAVRVAAEQGARVVSIVPPAHVWENAKAVAMLEATVAEARRRVMQIVFMRIDASYPPDRRGHRENYLYGHILTEPGRLSDGRPSADFFLTTAGRAGYAEWMEEETRYYASHYGSLPNLIGIGVGPFVEPFASERGAFLQWDPQTERYELAQYTPEAAELWHEWLRAHYADVAGVNREYETAFGSIADVPMPATDEDARFARAGEAYFDFARTFNDWFLARYESCQRLWHEAGGRPEVPFILQFSGLEAEKIANGRPGLAAFDLPQWIARADAVGLSLYANGGYEDHGHASIVAMVRLAALARAMGKDTFVLESGYEAPNVLADRRELAFLAEVSRPLSPRTWIYEFLKDKFDEQYASNPGKILGATGRVRTSAAKAVREAFRRATTPGGAERPALRVAVDARATRTNRRLAWLANGLFDLASALPLLWVAGDAAVESEAPLIRVDESLQPTDPLRAALLSVPEPDFDSRAAWRERVAAALGVVAR
jgi:hypothetical protein